MSEAQIRINQINNGLAALNNFGWTFLEGEIDARISDLTEQLINNNNDETRGRIKALQDVKNMPFALQSERESMQTALSEQDAVD